MENRKPVGVKWRLQLQQSCQSSQALQLEDETMAPPAMGEGSFTDWHHGGDHNDASISQPLWDSQLSGKD